MKVTRAHIGMAVRFVGYDNQVYFATLTDYRKGIAHIEYPVRRSDGSVEQIRTWLARIDHNRLIGE